MSDKEYVYFIKCNPNQHHTNRSYEYVKIGMSNSIKGIKRRFSTLQVGNPFKLELLGYIEGNENYFHNYFMEYKVSGEWFIYDHIKIKLKEYNLIKLDVGGNKIIHYNFGEGYSDDKATLKNELLFRKVSRALIHLYGRHNVKIKTKRNDPKDDYFGYAINVNDPYIMITNHPADWSCELTLSLQSAYKIYCLFKEMIRYRSDDMYYQIKYGDVKSSLSNLKKIWKDDFEHLIFDEIKNNVENIKRG